MPIPLVVPVAVEVWLNVEEISRPEIAPVPLAGLTVPCTLTILDVPEVGARAVVVPKERPAPAVAAAIGERKRSDETVGPEEPSRITTPPAPVTVTIAEFETLKRLVPLDWKSTRFPPKPEAELTPKPVPEVFQAVVVAPVGSIRTCGLVVVAEPPENQVPVRVKGGIEAAPTKESICCPVNVLATVVALLLNVDQSADAKAPLTEAEAVGKLNV